MNKTVYLTGGLGNVLFQLFEGFKLRDKIVYNTYFIQPNFFTRSILRWRIHENEVLPLIENIQLESKSPPVRVLFKLLFLKLRDTDVMSGRGIRIKNHVFGYFQDTKIDRDTRDFNEFVMDLRSRLIHLGPVLKYDNVLHFRLGDSVWAKGKVGYYLRAYDLLIENGRLYIVTDDAAAVKCILRESGRNEQDYEILTLSTLETFMVMIHAKFLAVAPSTFSWWASQLSTEAELVMESDLYTKFGSNRPVRWVLS